jgi:hypothetical protein
MMADQSCAGHGGGHITLTCRTCHETEHGPPLNTHCTALEGPAAVRISTSATTQVLEWTAANWIPSRRVGC